MLYNTTINRYMCTYNVFCTGITINEGGKKSISTKKEEKVVKMKSMCMCAFNMTFMCVYPQKQPRVVTAHILELVLRTSKQSLKWISTSVFYYELLSC